MGKWEQILEQINNVCNGSISGRNMWFRGINNSNHSLTSGLYRLSTNGNNDKIRDIERNIFHYFVNYGDSLFEFDKNNKWNILFCMQHFRMKTRLLDWTTSFLTALYFANLNRKKGTDACIWVLDPLDLNLNAYTLLGDNRDRGYLYSIDTIPDICKDYTVYFEQATTKLPTFALLPRMSNRRLIAQNGVFTVQGTDGKPLDEEYPNMVTNGKLVKIELPWDTFEDSQRWLKINGVNGFSLFPDLEGLSNYIVKELLDLK
jgi:hypothetical protein